MDEIKLDSLKASPELVAPEAGPVTKKRVIKTRHTIDELLERTDFEALADDENLDAWLKAKPVGREIL